MQNNLILNLEKASNEYWFELEYTRQYWEREINIMCADAEVLGAKIGAQVFNMSQDEIEAIGDDDEDAIIYLSEQVATKAEPRNDKETAPTNYAVIECAARLKHARLQAERREILKPNPANDLFTSIVFGRAVK